MHQPLALQLLAQMETLVTQHQEPVSVELLPPVLVRTLAMQPLTHAVSFYPISDIFHVTCQMSNNIIYFLIDASF